MELNVVSNCTTVRKDWDFMKLGYHAKCNCDRHVQLWSCQTCPPGNQLPLNTTTTCTCLFTSGMDITRGISFACLSYHIAAWDRSRSDRSDRQIQLPLHTRTALHTLHFTTILQKSFHPCCRSTHNLLNRIAFGCALLRTRRLFVAYSPHTRQVLTGYSLAQSRCEWVRSV